MGTGPTACGRREVGSGGECQKKKKNGQHWEASVTSKASGLEGVNEATSSFKRGQPFEDSGPEEIHYKCRASRKGAN